MAYKITDATEAIEYLRSPLSKPAHQELQRDMSYRARDIVKIKGTLGFVAVDQGRLRPEFGFNSHNNAVAVNATPLVTVGQETIGLRMRPIENRTVIDLISIGPIDSDDRERYPALVPDGHIIAASFNPSGDKLGSSTKKYVDIPNARGQVSRLHLEAVGLLLDAIDEEFEGKIINLGGLRPTSYPHAIQGELLERDGTVIQLGF